MSDKSYLILRLHAPMASFGGVVLDNFGVTRNAPALSMVTGLFANALGWHRSEAQKHQDLQSNLDFAVRMESPALPRHWRDFQTAELGAKDKHWTTSGIPAGRAGGANTYAAPHLRYRDYLHDVSAALAVGLHNEAQAPTIDTLRQALLHPARPLFIGRKACLPSQPLFQSVIESQTAVDALRCAPIPSEFESEDGYHCYWAKSATRPNLPEQVKVHETALSDQRDWANNQHTGSRTVCEARVSASWFKEAEPCL